MNSAQFVKALNLLDVMNDVDPLLVLHTKSGRELIGRITYVPSPGSMDDLVMFRQDYPSMPFCLDIQEIVAIGRLRGS